MTAIAVSMFSVRKRAPIPSCGRVPAGRGGLTPLSYRADPPFRPAQEGIQYWIRGLTLNTYIAIIPTLFSLGNCCSKQCTRPARQRAHFRPRFRTSGEHVGGLALQLL